MSPQNIEKPKFLLALLHIAFFVSGIATVLIGQVLPILSKKLALDDAQASYFFTFQFSGSLLGTFLTNWFGKNNKFLFAANLGCFLMAGGIAFLNADSYAVCLFAFFLNGIGIGLTLPSINMLVLEFNTERSGSALSILNVFWGLGAIVSQPFIDFFARGTNIFAPMVMISGALVLTGAAIIFQPAGIERKPKTADDAAEDYKTPIWSNPVAWAIAFFNFVHVGFESAIGGWLKTYTQRLEESAHRLEPIALYFLFFVLGRAAAPVFFRFLDENKMLLLGLLIILLGMIVLLAAQSVVILSVSATFLGFGTSWIFPTNVSRFTKIFGASASRRATPLFLAGTLGATFTTWFVGYLSNVYDNNLRVGMIVLLVSILILIGLQIVLSLRKTNTPPSRVNLNL